MQSDTDGVEIKLYDPERQPAHWTEILLASQCGVIVKDLPASAPLSRSCEPLDSAADATCTIFDSIDAAQRFSESTVAAHPNVRCEILDREGLTHPPLLVILHPQQHPPDEPGAFWEKRRRVIAAVLFSSFRTAPPVGLETQPVLPIAHVLRHQHDRGRSALRLLGFWTAPPRPGASQAPGSAPPARSIVRSPAAITNCTGTNRETRAPDLPFNRLRLSCPYRDTMDRFEQLIRPHGLRQIAIHARIQAALIVSVERVRR